MGQCVPPRPIVGIVADMREVDGMPYHVAQDKYLSAVWELSGVLPVVLPAFGGLYNVDELCSSFDGIMLTGCVSNIEPWRYGGPNDPPCGPHDAARDATVLPLIPSVLAAGVPLLAICRGLQEINVALGGTLTPRIHELNGRFDHRAPEDIEPALQYGPAHSILVQPGGRLAQILETAGLTRGEFGVNSLHWQGIDRLAPGLQVEALAPDGTIEAVSARSDAFCLGVQWHPEWEASNLPLSTTIFQAFGEAVRARRASQR